MSDDLPGDGPGTGGNGLDESYLPPDAYAVVFREADGFSIAMPDETEEVPAEVAALFAAVMRLQSEDGFLEEQLAWLAANQDADGEA